MLKTCIKSAPPPAGRLPAGSSGGFPSRFMRGAETEIPRRATCAEHCRAGIQRRDAMFTLRRRNLSSVYTSASSRPVPRDFTSGSVRDFRNIARRFANYFVRREHVAGSGTPCYTQKLFSTTATLHSVCSIDTIVITTVQ